MPEMMLLRQRVMSLTLMYRSLRHTQEDNGTWSWFLLREIEEIEESIADLKTKIVATMDDKAAHQPLNWFNAVLIIPQNHPLASPNPFDEYQTQ